MIASEIRPPDELSREIEARAGALSRKVQALLGGWLNARDPTGFRKAELEIAQVAQAFADQVTALLLDAATRDLAFRAGTSSAVRAAGTKMLHGGTREVEICLLGGGTVSVNVEYFRPDLSGRPGPKRGPGRRGPGGAGVYPVLAALGVAFGVTPALAVEICRQVADSDSVRSGRSALDRRGADLGHKQTLRIFDDFAHRAVAQRLAWLDEQRKAPLPERGVLRGKRVVVTTDGGRIRTRVALRGRPRKETGHHRYDAPWREPKLLVIYVVDEKGKVDEKFRPVYDGTLGDCEALFDMLVGYLRALGAHQAKEITFLGDGALWIWERTAELARLVGVPPERVHEVIDWYHAVEVLGKIAKLRAGWAEGEQARWLDQAKEALHAGKISSVEDLISGLAVGRRAKAVKKHLPYFTRNQARMQYASFREKGLPIGSGSVESAVRRIVNMRMKGNATFWKEENAEGMLVMRCYLKAGRFDELADWSTASAAKWWCPEKGPGAPLSEIQSNA